MDRRQRTFFQKQDGSVILETALMITVLADPDVRHGGLRRASCTRPTASSRPLARAHGSGGPALGREYGRRFRIRSIARFNPYRFGGDNLKNAISRVGGRRLADYVDQGDDRVPVQVDHSCGRAIGMELTAP